MTKTVTIAVAVFALVGPVWAEDITGRVRFLGPIPPPKEVTLTDGSTLLHQDLVVDKQQGLRDVVVVLEDVPARPKLEKAKPVMVDQKDMAFVPRVLAIQQGTPVQFANSDLHNHSVLASSTLPDNQLNTFVVPGKPVEHTFVTQKHPVQIGCSLHPWMRAWIFVVPHGHFAVSNEQGRFRIPDVPPGRHSVLFRHPDTGLQERRTVEVKKGKAAEILVDWRGLPAK